MVAPLRTPRAVRNSEANVRALEAARAREAEDIFDCVDVPAAVICALCGYADCPGCEHEASRSGVVALVAWERPGAPFFGRLWLTATGTTRTPELFFEGLPDGPILPALRFAVVCELVAIVGMLISLVPLVAFFAPRWLHDVLANAASRELAGRIFVGGVPFLATLLVLAHALHGLALDVGAHRAGAPHAWTRALRFGLYAAGWDLVLGPVGAILVAAKEGVRAGAGLFAEAALLPSRAARAFVGAAYRLEGAAAERAVAVASIVAIVVTFVGAALVLTGGVAVALL
jgi:hypothetical protein